MTAKHIYCCMKHGKPCRVNSCSSYEKEAAEDES